MLSHQTTSKTKLEIILLFQLYRQLELLVRRDNTAGFDSGLLLRLGY